MARPIWRGAISFGMVAIPVRLFAATESRDVPFRQLHREDRSRVRQLRWNPNLDREVPYDEIVRGYEYAKDQYVVLEEEDFAKLPLPTRHSVRIRAFVRLEEIDPVHYERAYYLEPDEVGVRPFALLLRAMEAKGLTAIAQIAIRNKQRLCALRPGASGRILLETLYYPDEIRTAALDPLADVEVPEDELEMAFTLIGMLETAFRPEDYRDEYREALMRLIEARLEGQEIAEPEAPETAKVIDLMAALRASVEAAGGQAAPAADGGDPGAKPGRTARRAG